MAESTRDRLMSLLRRRRQPVSVDERAAVDAELREIGRKAAPPRERAERRPSSVGERR